MENPKETERFLRGNHPLSHYFTLHKFLVYEEGKVVGRFAITTYPEDAAAGVFDGENPFKSTYVIPKPFDIRVVPRVAARVAEAAIKTGVAQVMITDFDAYEKAVAADIAAQRKA